MALHPKIDAAIRFGVSVELLEWFVKHCPKRGENRKLPATDISGELYFDEAELDDYRDYLKKPWPKTPQGQRPHIPDPIMKDIKEECHYQCAICCSMDNGEVAHIKPVSVTQDNSPDNLLYLCPNHHTKYDDGVFASNIKPDVVHAAKLMKRESRQRIMRFESNVVRGLRSLMNSITDLEDKVRSTQDAELIQVLGTETQQLYKLIPDLMKEADSVSRQDKALINAERLIQQHAPTVVAAIALSAEPSVELNLSVISSDNAELDEDMLDLDEAPCPRCNGFGTTGLNGDYCDFCKGDCYVSTDAAGNYDPMNIDETECPRCEGRGLVGLNGDWCPYCHGSCFVSREIAHEFTSDTLDEVSCPRCGGTGQTGYGNSSDICVYCNGRQRISSEEADEYDPKQIEQVECPRCEGKGTRGMNNDYCLVCNGSQFVPYNFATTFDPNQVDEIDCPHCGGSGQPGLSGELCTFCKGACTMRRSEAALYDPI